MLLKDCLSKLIHLLFITVSLYFYSKIHALKNVTMLCPALLDSI